MKRESQLIYPLLAIAALVLSYSCSGGIKTEPSADERLYEFRSGDVRSSVSYLMATTDTSVTLDDMIEQSGKSSGFNIQEFNEDGLIVALFNDIEFQYDKHGEFINGTSINSDAKTMKLTRDSKGRIVEYGTGGEFNERSFIANFEYDENGDAVVSKTGFWEGEYQEDYTFNKLDEKITSTTSYSLDYETEVTITTKYKVLERDSHGNWTKRLESTIEESCTHNMIDESNVTRQTNNSDQITIRDIEYYD